MIGVIFLDIIDKKGTAIKAGDILKTEIGSHKTIEEVYYDDYFKKMCIVSRIIKNYNNDEKEFFFKDVKGHNAMELIIRCERIRNSKEKYKILSSEVIGNIKQNEDMLTPQYAEKIWNKI